MKTMGVTFGDGAFLEIAEAMAKRFSEINDLETMVLDIDPLPPMPSGTWAKSCMWDQLPEDVDRVIWFDADVIPIAPITDLLPHPDVVFAAVKDLYHGGRQHAEWTCPEVIELPAYYNMGVFVANRETRPMFEAVRERMYQYDWVHGDQTPTNLELFARFREGQILELPRSANWMMGFSDLAPPDMRMLHLAGQKSGPLRFALLHAFRICFEHLSAEELAKKGGASCSGSCAL